MDYIYQTRGTCSRSIKITLHGNVVEHVEFTGGCNGNAKGIAALVRGMTVEEIEQKLSGTTCGMKNTSCPDQLAIAVRKAYQASQQQ